MFRTAPLSINRRFSLYTRHWYLSANLYVLLCVQSKTPDGGQRNCPKHVEFYSKNKFEKLVHLVGFIVRIILGRLVKKIFSLYGTLNSTTTFASGHHRTPYCANKFSPPSSQSEI